MKRRLLIARALINNPKIVVLDEPTIGLDPQAKYLVWRKLAELKLQGVTLLLCTQNMDEAAALCDRVAIMHQGKILTLDTPAKLIRKYVGDEVWEIDVMAEHKENIIKELKSHNLDFEDFEGKIHVFRIDSDKSLKNLPVNFPDKISHRTGTLEDVFLRLTGRTLVE